jgi:hypothetical protein
MGVWMGKIGEDVRSMYGLGFETDCWYELGLHTRFHV